MFSDNRYSIRYENFTNDIYSLFNKVQYSNYSRIPLTYDNNDIETDKNVVFGYAVRSITNEADYHINPLIDYNNNIDNKPIYFVFEINANLYILGGQVYDEPKQAFYNQKYYVKLLNEKTKESLILGDLVKDGDGMYKLHYKTDVANINKVLNKSINDLLEYNIVEIVYGAYDTTGKEVNTKVVIKGDLNKTP
jgi:hypothetical protein